MAFIRRVKTASGATAIQIVTKQKGQIAKIRFEVALRMQLVTGLDSPILGRNITLDGDFFTIMTKLNGCFQQRLVIIRAGFDSVFIVLRRESFPETMRAQARNSEGFTRFAHLLTYPIRERATVMEDVPGWIFLANCFDIRQKVFFF